MRIRLEQFACFELVRNVWEVCGLLPQKKARTQDLLTNSLCVRTNILYDGVASRFCLPRVMAMSPFQPWGKTQEEVPKVISVKRPYFSREDTLNDVPFS